MLLPLLVLGDGAIRADRPGFLNSPTLVPPGRWQLETGIGLASQGGASDAASTPVALRYGLREDLELRASTSGWNHVDAHGASDAHGWGDLTLGVKRPLDPHWADLDLSSAEALSWTAELRLPSGSRDIGSKGLGASLSGVGTWALGERSSLGASAGLSWDPDADSLVASFAASSAVEAWETGSLYAELGWFPVLRSGEDPLFAGCGATELLSNDVRLDLFVDAGLGASAGEWLAGFGISWRW